MANKEVMVGIATFLLLLLLGIVLTVTSQVNESIQDTFVTGAAGCNSTSKVSCGYDYNSTHEVLTGQDDFADQMPTVFLLGAVGLLLALLVGAFAFVRLR